MLARAMDSPAIAGQQPLYEVCRVSLARAMKTDRSLELQVVGPTGKLQDAACRAFVMCLLVALANSTLHVPRGSRKIDGPRNFEKIDALSSNQSHSADGQGALVSVAGDECASLAVVGN